MHGMIMPGSNPTTSVVNKKVAKLYMLQYYFQYVEIIKKFDGGRDCYLGYANKLSYKESISSKIINIGRLTQKQQKERT